jgi:hypothetical protein
VSYFHLARRLVSPANEKLGALQVENASQVNQTPDLPLLSTTSLQHWTNNINLARDLSEIELSLSTDTRNGSH